MIPEWNKILDEYYFKFKYQLNNEYKKQTGKKANIKNKKFRQYLDTEFIKIYMKKIEKVFNKESFDE